MIIRTRFWIRDAQERARGITIFSKQAVLQLEGAQVFLLDTPGHVDFSSEMERTLQVLDYAILVINGSDGVQSHTRTLWRLLERYGIPVFLFVNKMDLPGTDSGRLLQELKNKLSTSCVDFTVPEVDRLEDMAVCDEAVLAEFLEHETVQKGEMIRMIGERRLFPVYFGSALRLRGVGSCCGDWSNIPGKRTIQQNSALRSIRSQGTRESD